MSNPKILTILDRIAFAISLTCSKNVGTFQSAYIHEDRTVWYSRVYSLRLTGRNFKQVTVLIGLDLSALCSLRHGLPWDVHYCSGSLQAEFSVSGTPLSLIQEGRT